MRSQNQTAVKKVKKVPWQRTSKTRKIANQRFAFSFLIVQTLYRNNIKCSICSWDGLRHRVAHNLPYYTAMRIRTYLPSNISLDWWISQKSFFLMLNGSLRLSIIPWRIFSWRGPIISFSMHSSLRWKWHSPTGWPWWNKWQVTTAGGTVGWARATKAGRLGSIPGRVISRIWITSCSALMGRCEGTVHARCCHCANKRRRGHRKLVTLPKGVQNQRLNETELN